MKLFDVCVNTQAASRLRERATRVVLELAWPVYNARPEGRRLSQFELRRAHPQTIMVCSDPLKSDAAG